MLYVGIRGREMPRRLESRHQVNRTQPIHNKITFSSYTRIITHATPSHYITLHPLNVHHTTPSLITLPSSWHSSYLTLPPFITSYRIISSPDDVYWLYPLSSHHMTSHHITSHHPTPSHHTTLSSLNASSVLATMCIGSTLSHHIT